MGTTSQGSLMGVISWWVTRQGSLVFLGEGHCLWSLFRVGSLVVLHLLSVLVQRKRLLLRPRAGTP